MARELDRDPLGSAVCLPAYQSCTRRTSRINFGALVALLLSISALQPPVAAPAHSANKKKVVYYGWGLPDTQYVREHWREMEEMPLDGVGVLVAINRRTWQQGVRGDSNQLGRQITGVKQFRADDFDEAIADLTTAHWQSFTDNFLPVALSLSPYTEGLNWFDDARWNIVANNFQVIARIASRGGTKGLMIDPEHYGYFLFSYESQSKQQYHPFESYERMARQRGREVMQAIASEFPDVTLLSFYGHTLLLKQLHGYRTLSEADYSLLPAFYDGLLESMGRGACLYDGYEFSYGFKERKRFSDAYDNIRRTAVSVSSVPDSYRRSVRAAFGLWLDRNQQFNYFTPQEFQSALTSALEVSDGYVWIYGQSFRFFPPSRIPPSFVESIAAARRSAR
ncbi:MAG TPA: hypothetical protein VKM94_19250 [Blastocatellia bacterium]|nr:hypothetical protein [Blastocatellia bacterium]